MKISKNWLGNYVDLGDRSAEEIADALTLVGLEVEEVEEHGLPQLDNVVVGEVLTREQHPDADRLGVCDVNVGDGTNRSIVCGATNYTIGDRVPVALPGAVLPGGFKIKKSKLRGVPSEGMMCSAKELGLGEDHAGLLILGDRPEIGTTINEVFTDTDVVFDIGVTPNRADALSHIGVARDLCAYWGERLSYPEVKADTEHERHPALITKLSVTCPDACPHYRAYSIRNVSVGPSPEWLKKALTAIGLRPVNNVVDVTNYVLHETGHPMHAFDAAKIDGGEIIVRKARSGEKITTLDGKARELRPSMTVIAGANKALVVGGVMGSLDAEVDATTTDILLEAAYFDAVDIRKTARALGISSDSSYRYERGVDPRGAVYAALRAIDLILEVAGGEITGPPLVAGEPPMIEREIALDTDFLRERIGYDVSDKEIQAVLESLELDVGASHPEPGKTVLMVGIPSFRIDLDRPIDLVEEFVRIHGTDKIPDAPVTVTGLNREDDGTSRFVAAAGAYLSGQHFMECMNYTTRPAEEIARWFSHADSPSLGLANPLLSDQTHIRTSLIPGLLENLRLNRHNHAPVERLFEVGHIFREDEGKIWELLAVSFLIVQSPLAESWQPRTKPDEFTAKAILDNVLTLGGVDIAKVRMEPIVDKAPWQPGHAARSGNFKTGWECKFGLVSMPMLKAYDLDGTVLAGVAYFAPDFLNGSRDRVRIKQWSVHPPTTRDLAIIVNADKPAGDVRADLRKFANAAVGGAFNVESVEVFDVYVGDGVPEGQKSLALAIRFRSHDRTLNDKEVNKAFDAIQKSAQDAGYTLRV